MSEPTIRPAVSAPELTQAIEVVRVQFEPPIASEDPRFVDLYEHFKNDSDLCLIATKRGEILGAALGFRTAATQATLRVLAVRSQERGTGLGRALLKAFEEAAARLGVGYLALGADEAAEFYASCGWTPVLMLQWVHDPAAFKAEAAAVRQTVAIDRPVKQSCFNGVPQLFVELNSVDREAVASAAEMAPGALSGLVMNKRLAPPHS
jgi:GNAT superfamily N-acetyltransferase